MSAYPDTVSAREIGRRTFLATSALIFSALPKFAFAQALSELLEGSKCTLPLYFPVEVFYAGRLTKTRSILKIQVNNFTTRRARDEFLELSQAEKDDTFIQKEPVHEFITLGNGPFGDSPADSYKGLEQSGDLYLFKYRGSGEDLRNIAVTYRHIPDHGQVVSEEIGAREYFNRLLDDVILPKLRECSGS